MLCTSDDVAVSVQCVTSSAELTWCILRIYIKKNKSHSYSRAMNPSIAPHRD